jgi:hypothetical protein
MGDQRRRSRSGYITGYQSPLGVDKSEDASPINRPLGYEPSQGRLTCPDWMHWNWSVRLLAPVSSALSQPTRLVAQRLVTAAVTKYGPYFLGLLPSWPFLKVADGASGSPAWSGH